jgi:hypothetical protein
LQSFLREKKELNSLIQVDDKFKLAGRDQWDKLAVRLFAPGREINLGWKLRKDQTCQNRFDCLILKQKSSGSTESDNTFERLLKISRKSMNFHHCPASKEHKLEMPHSFPYE